MSQALLDAALAYAKDGWAVFPCRPGAKEPLVSRADGGHGHLDATTNPTQIAAWWGMFPDANIGVALDPSGLIALDVDVAEGKPGRASLAEIDADLPSTLTAITGRGGLHAIYTRPSDVPAGRRIGFKPGLDLLGDGYIIVAPSVLREGGTYRWNARVSPVPLPNVLKVLSAVRPPVPKAGAEREDIVQGNRNDALFRLGAALRDSGIGIEALARALDAENRERFKPPVDDTELRQIVDSIWRRVVPSRDVAAGAIVEQEIHQIFTPPERAVWVRDIGAATVPPMRFYTTGFPKLDELLGGGFASRHQCGVLGPPSSGKSAFVDCVVHELQKQIPVLHISTELPRDELFVRKACARLGIPWRNGMRGEVPREDMRKAVDELRIKIIGSEDIDRNDPFGSIRHAAQIMAQQTGIAPAVVIDYMQLLARGAADQMRHRVGELSMQARLLAQELDTPVIAVYSTRRDYYSTQKTDAMRKFDDPTAYLAAAKESGDVEFDCATMLYLDVDKLHEGQPKPARIAVPRCRIGDIGFVGARARLDIGTWWEDESAKNEMSVDARAARIDEESFDSDKEKLLETIRKCPGRPWRELRIASRLRGERADKARDALLADGVLERRSVVGYDDSKRRQTRATLVECAPVSPPGSPKDSSDED